MELADETITHEATPIGYKTDASHPKGGRDEGNFVANAASQEIGSSTQALINGRHCSHGTEGTQASRVGHTRAGGLPTVIGPIRVFAPQGPVPLAQSARPMCRGRPPRSSLPHGRRAESFADDLNTLMYSTSI